MSSSWLNPAVSLHLPRRPGPGPPRRRATDLAEPLGRVTARGVALSGGLQAWDGWMENEIRKIQIQKGHPLVPLAPKSVVPSR